jgi:hypothetical protein
MKKKQQSLSVAFARSAMTGTEPMTIFLRKDFRKLWKMRLEFPWVPGILGEYMRNKANEDLRGIVSILRANKHD